MLRNLRILGMPLLIMILVSCTLPSAYSSAANAQDPIAGIDGGSQLCDELQHRGSSFEQLANVCQYAVTAPHTLPDIVCTETVTQYLSPKQKPEIIKAELNIEKTRSHYSAVTVNGKTKPGYDKTGDILFEELVGSTGEFAMLFNVFNGSSHAEFASPVNAAFDRRRLKRYDFRVKRENNLRWTWFFADTAINPGYHGSIFVDTATGKIFRLVIQVSSDEVDLQTPVSEATTTIDYGDVRMLKGCTRAQLTFDNFHKFGSTVRVVPVP